MLPDHFLIRYPQFCGIYRSADRWDDCEFYVRRSRASLPDDLADPEEHYYEPFCEYEFKYESSTRIDMLRVEEWIKSNQFDSDGDPINDEYEGWYWGEVPKAISENYTKVG